MQEPDNQTAMDNKLECSLCLEDFKDPRILSCFHTYCRNCLETYIQKSSRTADSIATFDCPICRTAITLPQKGVDGLQKNFYLLEEKKPKSSHPMCTLHSNEDLRFYCRNCAELVCRDCKVVAHDGHSINMVDNVVAEMKLKLKQLLDNTEKCINENEINQRTVIESDIQTLETAISDITKYTEEMNKEIQDLLTYANMQVLLPRIQTKQGKVLSIQSQCGQKISKLNLFKEAFTRADTQNDSHIKLKVFKELIKKEEHIKLLKYPARISNDGEVVKDSFVTSRLNYAFKRLRDHVHQSCLQVLSTYCTHKGKTFSDELTSQSAKRQPSPSPCPTLPKRPRSVDSTMDSTKTDNQQQTPQSLPDQLEKVVVGISLGVGHLAGLDHSRTKAYCICSRPTLAQKQVSPGQTKQFQPVAVNTLPETSYLGNQRVKPVQEVKPQTETTSQSRQAVATRALENKPDKPKDLMYSAWRQSVLKPAVEFSNSIDANRVKLKNGGKFQEGEIYVLKDNIGRERKMTFTGGRLVDSPASQGNKTTGQHMVRGHRDIQTITASFLRQMHSGRNVGGAQSLGRVIPATATRPSDSEEMSGKVPGSKSAP